MHRTRHSIKPQRESAGAPVRAGLSERNGDHAPPIVHEVLSSEGRPLEASTRGFMEQRFGHDFSRVRVHDDSRAAASARAVHARAYSAGSQIVFGEGKYAPANDAGRRLLAHELAHVVQQDSATQPRLLRAPNDLTEQAHYPTADERKGVKGILDPQQTAAEES